MMQSKSYFRSALQFAAGATLGLCVVALVCFNALLLWVATGPRNIDYVSPAIEASLVDADHSFSVIIGETWLIWDGWKHPIDIRLRNVSVLTKERQRFSRFPEISVGVDVVELLRGNLLPSSLTITHPVLSLYQNDDRSISFGFNPEAKTTDAIGVSKMPTNAIGVSKMPTAEALSEDAATNTSVPFALVLNQLLKPEANSPLRKLHNVTILNADISVGNTHSGVFFTATESNLVFKNNNKSVQAFGSAKITYNEDVIKRNESSIEANFNMLPDGTTINGDISFTSLMPGTLSDLFTSKTELSALKFPVRGKGKLLLDRNGTLQNLDFILDGSKGTIETERLATTLPVTSMHAEGTLTEGGSGISIRQFNLDLDGMTIDAQADVAINGNDSAITGHVLAKNIPNDNLNMLWPLGLAPESRDWVTKNIYSGTYASAEARINIASGDLAKPILPREAIDADVVLQGASITYLPEHPEVTGVNATIHIDGLTLNAKFNEGHYMRDTSIAGGELKIDDLNDDNPYMKLSFDAHSSGRDVVKFLGLPRLGHAKRLGLSEDNDSIIDGHADLGFRFYASKENSDDDIDYNLRAEVKNLNQPNLLGRFDVEKATGTVLLDNKRLEFKGAGNVNGAKVSETSVTYLFRPENGYDTFITATATAPITALPRFGYPAFDFMKGTLGAQLTLKTGDNKEDATATIDLTAADIDFKPVHYTKPAGEEASLEIVTAQKDNAITIPSFRVKGKKLDGKGSAALAKDKSDLARVNFEGLTYGDNNLSSLTYEKLSGGFRLDAQGTQADLSPWFAYKKGEDSTFTFEHFPVMRLNVNLGQVILGEDRVLKSINGTLDCDATRCNSADFSGKTSDSKPFQFRILKNPKGKRQVSLHAQSAGAFLKTVGLFDSMEGGDLTVTGTYEDKAEKSVLKARADISAYTIRDAPVLAKMLSLASLTGFFDTLQGNGIEFQKLRAPFTLSNAVITVKEAKTFGNAMGMTIDGTIIFPKQTLDLSGTIVPSYSANTILGKVPFIGAALMGGEGKGIFAASYSIKGSANEPNVSVNPLSILTPGFLRGLFDIFDSPKQEEEE